MEVRLTSLSVRSKANVSIVIKLFNVIQQAQVQAVVAEESLKAQRGSGKPTLPAPSLTKGKGKKKEKQKDNLLGRPAESEAHVLPNMFSVLTLLYSSCWPR